MSITFGEIFAGIGAANAAFLPLGWENKFFVENNGGALAQYLFNWDQKFHDFVIKNNVSERDVLAYAREWNIPHKFNDIYKVSGGVPAAGSDSFLPDADIFMTSPPCQSFSQSGLRNGLGAEKGDLFFETHRILKEALPKVFVLENVAGMMISKEDPEYDGLCAEASGEYLYHYDGKFKGVLNTAGRNTFYDIILPSLGFSANVAKYEIDHVWAYRGLQNRFVRLEQLPYRLYFKLVKAEEFGIPMLRPRVFIIGVRRDIRKRFQFPPPAKSMDSISAYVNPRAKRSDYFRFVDFEKGTKRYERAVRSRKRVRESGIIGLGSPYVNTFTTGTIERSVVVQKPNGDLRSFADEQRRALMGFPLGFNSNVVSFTAAIKNYGNSISVPTLQAIGRSLEKVLR